MTGKTVESALISRRALVVGATFAATAAAAYAVTPRRSENRLARRKLSDVIGDTVGPWRFASTDGVVVARGEEENVDGYDQVLTRVYAAPDLPSIMLLIAYGSTQGGSLQLHLPETCYPGQGFRLADVDDLDLDLPGSVRVGMRKFTALRDERVERVLYWTRISQSFPQSSAAVYRAIITSVLSGTVPDGVLVRVSAIGTDVANADRALTAFAKALVTDAPPAGRQLLVGR